MADGRDFDVAIVGAGAAGIAACHRLSAAKLRVVALKARLGAPILSCALPGHVDDRVTLARPIEDRLFFVGEACSRDQFGTAHAALTTAVSAAERIIVVLAPAS
jgi:choline dehydrogenase-like flavoprotein